MSEPKSRTVELRVDGETLAEFIVDQLSVEISRYRVDVRGGLPRHLRRQGVPELRGA